MARVPTPKRGEVWLVDFDPSIGAEIRKVRPAVVISRDSIGRLPLPMVVPITDWKPGFAAFPWFTHLPSTRSNGLAKESGADAFQTNSISETRLVQKLGVITQAQLDDIATAIALCVDAP